jgi:UDP:flavonoid glycosyltransferase YjiC (YdhE family)
MHILLATLGTDGDVMPYVGLGSILRTRGHRVTLAAPELYRAGATQRDLEFTPLVPTEAVREMLNHPDMWHPLRSGPMMARWGARFLATQYEDLARLVRDDTVIVANPGVLAARLVRETHGCPMASLLLQPGLLPSIETPPQMPAGVTLPTWTPRFIGKLYWTGVDFAGALLAAGALNDLRRSLGLKPIRLLFKWWNSPDRIIGLFPPWYAPPPRDWPPQLRLAGFGHFDGGASSGLPGDVRAFCEAGTPPIVFTMGTGMTQAAEFFRTAVRACELLNARALLATKFPEQLPPNLPATIRPIAFAPFRALLPLCSAIVHHGGIGTTAAALSAGTPQLVLPLAWDQPDNAARVRRLGAGNSLPPKRRSAEDLANALSHLMTEAMRRRCRALAENSNERDGLDIAADMVEQFNDRGVDLGTAEAPRSAENAERNVDREDGNIRKSPDQG